MGRTQRQTANCIVRHEKHESGFHLSRVSMFRSIYMIEEETFGRARLLRAIWLKSNGKLLWNCHLQWLTSFINGIEWSNMMIGKWNCFPPRDCSGLFICQAKWTFWGPKWVWPLGRSVRLVNLPWLTPFGRQSERGLEASRYPNSLVRSRSNRLEQQGQQEEEEEEEEGGT